MKFLTRQTFYGDTKVCGSTLENKCDREQSSGNSVTNILAENKDGDIVEKEPTNRDIMSCLKGISTRTDKVEKKLDGLA